MLPKLIAIDLDETLLRSDKTYDRDRFKAVSAAFLEAGSLLAIVTGNSYHKIEDFFDDQERQSFYFACDNGNYMVKNEQAVYQNAIPRKIFADLVDYLQDQADLHPLVNVGTHAYYDSANRDFASLFKIYNRRIEEISDYHDIPSHESATKIAIHATMTLAEMKVVAQYINDHFDHVRAVTSGDDWIDINSDQGGKGAALRYLQDKYHILPQESLAFGDSLNDLSMMEEVKYSLAMENADPDLLAKCSYQIASNNQQAVIAILEEILSQGSCDFLDNSYAL